MSCLGHSIGFCRSERLAVQKRAQISLVHLVGVIGWGSCVSLCVWALVPPRFVLRALLRFRVRKFCFLSFRSVGCFSILLVLSV